MNILLDTHVLLWAITGSRKLTAKAKKLISDPGNTIYVSIISPWEVEIKHNKFPDRMPIGSAELLGFCKAAGYSFLSIRPSHIEQLPTLDHDIHADPFDRMLICQAKAEDMILITCDENVGRYKEKCICKI
ncbi:MAG: type II toxin-antitoxin system VapC family toxin [Clostridiales bacterium]|nr:type II toxin-antitoxin system VapC family toxin [Clostridiales bacterium]